MRTSRVTASRTRAWPSWRRSRAARTSPNSAPSSDESRAEVGARPDATMAVYTRCRTARSRSFEVIQDQHNVAPRRGRAAPPLERCSSGTSRWAWLPSASRRVHPLEPSSPRTTSRPRLASPGPPGRGEGSGGPRQHRVHAARLRALPVDAQPAMVLVWAAGFALAYRARTGSSRGALVVGGCSCLWWLRARAGLTGDDVVEAWVEAPARSGGRGPHLRGLASLHTWLGPAGPVVATPQAPRYSHD